MLNKYNCTHAVLTVAVGKAKELNAPEMYIDEHGLFRYEHIEKLDAANPIQLGHHRNLLRDQKPTFEFNKITITPEAYAKLVTAALSDIKNLPRIFAEIVSEAHLSALSMLSTATH